MTADTLSVLTVGPSSTLSWCTATLTNVLGHLGLRVDLVNSFTTTALITSSTHHEPGPD